jgi:hypothetical protein
MTDAATPPRNPYQTFLLIGGSIAVLLGGIIAIAAHNNAQDVDFTAQLVGSMVGGIYDSHAADGSYALMWFGIVVAILGAVMLIVLLGIRAGAQKSPARTG